MSTPKKPPPIAPRRNTGTSLVSPPPKKESPPADEPAGADEPAAPVAPVEPLADDSSAAEAQTSAEAPVSVPEPEVEDEPAPEPVEEAPPAPPEPVTVPPPAAAAPPATAAPVAAAPVARAPVVGGPPKTSAPVAPGKAPMAPAPVAPGATATSPPPKAAPPSRPTPPAAAAAASADADTAAAAARASTTWEQSDDEDDDDDGSGTPRRRSKKYVDHDEEDDLPAGGDAVSPRPSMSAASEPGALLKYFREANPNAMDTSVREILLAEGYLTKVKNLKIKAKSRHFRLTETTFAYYEANAESLIAKVKKTDIIHVEDVVNTKHFRVRTAVDFCRDPSEGSTEMLLVAKDMLAKEKWLAAFSLDLNRPPKDYERLICEGYLVKVQPMCTVSTTRWFVATNRSFGYYKAEGGPLYYKVLWDHIQYVSQTSNKKEFKLQASVPMTKTGFYDCTCRARTKQERDKWVAMMQRILPQQKMSTELQMCCFMEE